MSGAGSRDRVTGGLVGAVTLAAALSGLRVAHGAPSARNASVDVLIARFESIRHEVPRSVVMGYASGLPPTDPAFLMRQMLARYVLAPARLDVADAHPLVLADFESDAALIAYVTTIRGTLRAHPRAGLAVVERGQPIR